MAQLANKGLNGLTQKVGQIVKQLRDIGKQAVAVYENEVDQIISSSCYEKNRIELTLDRMLDFCFDKNMLALYKRLCRYYYYVDKSAATSYVYAYRDMWDARSLQKQPKPNIAKY